VGDRGEMKEEEIEFFWTAQIDFFLELVVLEEIEWEVMADAAKDIEFHFSEVKVCPTVQPDPLFLGVVVLWEAEWDALACDEMKALEVKA